MNLHDELGRHGADAADESAQRLSSSDVREALGARVRRGRRRRAVGGGVGTVAGIALVGVGVWGVLPGLGFDGEPAATPSASSTEAIADATRYAVSSRSDVSGVLPVDVRTVGDLQCGAELDLNSGVTVHDESVVEHGAALSVVSQRASITEQVYLDNVAELSGDAWQDLALENPAQVEVGENWHVFRANLNWRDGGPLAITTVPLLLHEGQVAGVGPLVDNTWEGSAGTGRIQPMVLWSPVPGECASGDVTFADGTYEPVMVTQVWSVSSDEPLATIVASAGEIEYTGLGEPEVEQHVAPDLNDMPDLGAEDYLTTVLGEREWSTGLGCEALVSDQGHGESVRDGSLAGSTLPVPSWIETGRLYGWGDDALVGGYPVPVTEGSGDELLMTAVEGVDEARLLIRGDDTMWVFDVRWLERDDLPHDEPGWFVELVQDWECGDPDLIEEGTYPASLVINSADGQAMLDLTSITVVGGVPSIPEIDAQG